MKKIVLPVVAALAIPLSTPDVSAGTPDSTRRRVHHHYPRRTYSTSYCLRGIMRDGTWTRRRSIAMNFLPLGTHITTNIPFRGLRRFVVRDTGSALYDGHMDMWNPSCWHARLWGRRAIRYRLGW